MGSPPGPGSVVPPRLAAAFLQAGHHLEHLIDPAPDHLALLAQHVQLLRQLAQLLPALLRRVQLGLQIAHLGLRRVPRSEEHTSELQSPCNLVCRLLLEKKKKTPCHRSTHPQPKDTLLPTAACRHTAHTIDLRPLRAGCIHEFTPHTPRCDRSLRARPTP